MNTKLQRPEPLTDMNMAYRTAPLATLLTLCLLGCGDESGTNGTAPASDAGAASDTSTDMGTDTAADTAPDAEPDVPPGNLPPVAVAGDDQNVLAGETVMLDGSASNDPEGEDLQFIWTQEQGNPVRFDTGSPTPVFIASEFTTEIVLALVVSDGDNLSVPDRLTIYVQGPNRAPIADAGLPQTGLLRDVVSLDGSRSQDPDGQEITYRWTQTAGPAVQLSEPGGERPRFVTNFDQATTLTFSLVVNDGEADSPPKDVTIEVRNHRPRAHAGRDGVVLLEGEFTLDGNASSDPDGDDITYRWSQVDGLPVDLVPPGSATPSFIAPDLAGPVVFQLVVHDGDTESVEDRVTVLAVGPGYVDTDRDQLRDESEAEVGTEVDSPDTDGDGIPDGWEALGHEGVDFHGIGTSPLHRDILLEVDYQGERLDEDLIAGLQAAFAGLSTENPDGETGIALHVVHDSELAPNFFCFFPGDGNEGDRSTLKRAHRDTFHKLQICTGPSLQVLTTSGRQIIVQTPPLDDDTVRANLVAAIVRGLGFNLGLRVGGSDNLDLKPNYPSVMNTGYAFSAPASFSDGTLPSLDECALTETTPFADTPVDALSFLDTYFDGGWTADETGNVDWNRNDQIDPDPYELVLRLGAEGCETLLDHDDGTTLQDSLAPALNVIELRP
jgi:hypothetical protein